MEGIRTWRNFIQTYFFDIPSRNGLAIVPHVSMGLGPSKIFGPQTKPSN